MLIESQNSVQRPNKQYKSNYWDKKTQSDQETYSSIKEDKHTKKKGDIKHKRNKLKAQRPRTYSPLISNQGNKNGFSTNRMCHSKEY